MKKIKAVLFDFDGTLVDSEHYYLDCGVQAMVELGVDREVAVQFFCEFIVGVRSDKKPPIFARKFPDLDYETYNIRYQQLCDDVRKKSPIKIKPGANELLHFLKEQGKKLAIVSMSTYDEVQTVCQQTGLDFSVFDIYFGGAGVPAKPDPTVYLTTMQALGVTPGETMVVEDSNVGAQAGLGAGATTVVVKDMSVLSAKVLAEADFILEKDCLIQVKDLF